MRHIIAEVSDVPDATPAADRRRTPDRRTAWRGGRRDSDWINRPPGALARLEGSRKVGVLRRTIVAIFTILHIG
jgi:hypothetical protein